jgi:multidrug efflux pump subunit AcrB
VFSYFAIDRRTLAAAPIVFSLVGGMLCAPSLAQQIKTESPPSNQSAASVFVHLTCRDGGYDQVYIGEYAAKIVQPALARIQDVDRVEVIGRRTQVLRLHPDVDRLKARGLTSKDLVKLLSEQNINATIERDGSQRESSDRNVCYLLTPDRERSISQIDDVILKVEEGGRVTRFRDVARVEMVPKRSGRSVTIDGKPAVGLWVTGRSNLEQLSPYDRVKAAMERLKQDFPKDLDFSLIENPTRLVEEALANPIAVPSRPAAATKPAQK